MSSDMWVLQRSIGVYNSIETLCWPSNGCIIKTSIDQSCWIYNCCCWWNLIIIRKKFLNIRYDQSTNTIDEIMNFLRAKRNLHLEGGWGEGESNWESPVVIVVMDRVSFKLSDVEPIRTINDPSRENYWDKLTLPWTLLIHPSIFNPPNNAAS